MNRRTSVLVVHNSYEQVGGEDGVVRSEVRLLEAAGHSVYSYRRHNGEIRSYSWWLKVTLPFRAVAATDAMKAVAAIARDRAPVVAHFHNVFPLVSPGAYHAVKREGVAVVQTLHNYRLLCANALFFRDGHPCEDCASRLVGWLAVRRACYRGSRGASAMIVGSVAAHRALRTWTQAVDVYIALTGFARQRMICGGLPAERVVVKPNFVHPDPGLGKHSGNFALYAGRLSSEKGIVSLLEGWARLRGGIPLKIIGDGSLRSLVERALQETPGVEWTGWRSEQETRTLMGEASMLVMPSLSYEGFPLVLAEAFARGLPAVVSGHGAMAEIVEHGRTGLHFHPGDPDDLAAKVEWAWTHPREIAEMGREARREYELKYTAERNYKMLMEIYDMAIAWARR